MKVLFLGTGTSRGVPSIGCSCPVCSSPDEKNKRLRPSVLIRENDYHLLIDTSSDFRQQMLRHKVDRIDAVLFTHHHADHLMGLDDIRAYTDRQGPIVLYAEAQTLAEIRITFRYVFQPQPYFGWPRLETEELNGPRQLGPLTVEPLAVMHGSMPITGYRIGDFAYLTDVSRIPDDVLPRLTGLRVLVLGALRHKPHPAHLSVGEAVAQAQAIGAGQTYFIHMTHELDHEKTNAQLPRGIQLSYDGLEVEL